MSTEKVENDKCKGELQKLRKMILVNAKDDNNEVITVKAAFNSVELQLYEAHEKIAEMLEFVSIKMSKSNVRNFLNIYYSNTTWRKKLNL